MTFGLRPSLPGSSASRSSSAKKNVPSTLVYGPETVEMFEPSVRMK
jgi:hypothetical protein